MTPEKALEIALNVLDTDPSKAAVWAVEPAVSASNGRRLTMGERDRIRVLVDAGWSSSRIARELSVTQRSVERHRSRLRAEVAAWDARRVREANLGSFQRMSEVWPVARGWAERQEKAA